MYSRHIRVKRTSFDPRVIFVIHVRCDRIVTTYILPNKLCCINLMRIVESIELHIYLPRTNLPTIEFINN